MKMEGTCYRSMTPTQSDATVGSRRRPSTKSRRSSTGSGTNFFWEGGHGGSPGLFSGSLLGRSIDVSELLHDAPASEPGGQQQWTAAERARCVAEDERLAHLLAAEIERAGVVTAAGYKAVHQKFLYSEEVEQALRRAPERRLPPQRRSGRRFSSIVSSIGAASATAAAVTASFTEGGSQATAPKKMGSAGSGASAEAPGHDSGSNLAPRRLSQGEDLTRSMQDALARETQEYREEERRKLMMDSFMNDLDGDDEKCAQDVATSKSVEETKTFAYRRRGSDESLRLEDVFDGAEGAHRLSPSKSKARPPQAGTSSDDTTAARTAYARLDAISSAFREVDFDPDTSHEQEVEDAERSFTASEKCGWLPWPAAEDDDASCGAKELAESFLSVEGGDGFLPWPDARASGRARAA